MTGGIAVGFSSCSCTGAGSFSTSSALLPLPSPAPVPGLAVTAAAGGGDGASVSRWPHVRQKLKSSGKLLPHWLQEIVIVTSGLLADLVAWRHLPCAWWGQRRKRSA